MFAEPDHPLKEEESNLARIESHRDLIVWQKALDLAVAVYELTEQFPSKEQYRLTSQIARAVASVPANIAEGHARSTRKDYANFLAIARGSLAETETFVVLAKRFGYVEAAALEGVLASVDEVGKMLVTLRKRLLAG
jgi:four helix bundle protein